VILNPLVTSAINWPTVPAADNKMMSMKQSVE
jgi:hypothetical protein